MKLYIFKTCLTIFAISFSIYTFGAQDSSKYAMRMQKYQERWSKLIPSHNNIQFAGSMGLISMGTGWDYGRKDQWETDIMLGFVPKYSTNRGKLCLTLKQNFVPWNIPIKKSNFGFAPLACGAYATTIFGEEFWIKGPDRYPKGYYGFATKLRFNFYLGQRITYDISSDKRIFARQLALYYEVSSSDLYLINAFSNPDSTQPIDFLHLSFGLKFQLF